MINHYAVVYTAFPNEITELGVALVKAYTAEDVKTQFTVHRDGFGDSKGKVRFTINRIFPITYEDWRQMREERGVYEI